MNPRLLKRLEDLLRLGLDPASSENERDVALHEALRTIVVARTGTDDSPWEATVSMRFSHCSKCGEDIPPAQRSYHRGETYMHRECYEDEVDRSS